ncbi:MAG: restriction endonuclease [Deltaproteobacteria bacterium]|nr:restriction endonuclease [Deltaproteobacteria bacterium]
MAEVRTLNFDYNIPDLLTDKIEVSDPYQNYNSRGNPTSFGVDLDFHEMHLSKTLKSSEFYLLRGKIEDTLRTWESKYQRHLDKIHKENRAEHVDELNQEAKEAIESLNNILSHTLSVDDTVDWDVIKRKDAFRVKPVKLFNDGNVPVFIKFNSYGRPTEFQKILPPAKPISEKIQFEKVKNEYGFFSRLFLGRKIKKDFDNSVIQSKKREEQAIKQWEKQIAKTGQANVYRERLFNQALAKFDNKKKKFEEEKQRENNALESIKARYIEKDPKAIEEYCDLVLNSSQYPDYFPHNWVLEYREDSRIAVVEYDLPAPDQLPTVEFYKYIKSRDEVSEKALTQAALKKLYDSVIYQICIRTIHELFEADVVNALDAVGFNGLVTNTNLATGIEDTKFIMSIMANKDQFMVFDLARVDPKATFKHMKGVAAFSLVNLTPIPPILQLDKSDKRFISGRNVVGNLDDSVNLAAMHWEDFEHLVRELFEKEFTSNGGEVKVTQASADGGVDAIAFDPDPIRGGKIVIQAKRYTNVVGVAAVRDLYGTVMNEGATKGVLVTTSDYGKDSYEFAKDKPLTLLNGSNLLSLLEKHGHKARINVTEAKKILNAQK